MTRSTLSLCLALTSLAPAGAFAASSPMVKPIQTVVAAVRQSRDSLALKYFASEEQGKLLTGPYWEKATAAQRQEFTRLFETLFAKIAFPKVRENFKNLDTILYGTPKMEGNKAKVDSTVLINHPLKKQELKLKYELANDNGWKVLDVAVLGDSMLKGIREDQVLPLLKEGGWEGLLKAMRQKANELKDKPL